MALVRGASLVKHGALALARLLQVNTYSSRAYSHALVLSTCTCSSSTDRAPHHAPLELTHQSIDCYIDIRYYSISNEKCGEYNRMDYARELREQLQCIPLYILKFSGSSSASHSILMGKQGETIYFIKDQGERLLQGRVHSGARATTGARLLHLAVYEADISRTCLPRGPSRPRHNTPFSVALTHGHRELARFLQH